MTQPQVVTFHYHLTNSRGEEIDSSRGREPLSFLAGQGQIIPLLETELLGMQPQEKRVVKIASVDGYGERIEQLVMTVEREQLPKDVQTGDMLRLENDSEVRPALIVSMTDTQAVIDANHPLAGVDLTFDVELVEIRAATKDELSHGHVHGAGCQH